MFFSLISIPLINNLSSQLGHGQKFGGGWQCGIKRTHSLHFKLPWELGADGAPITAFRHRKYFFTMAFFLTIIRFSTKVFLFSTIGISFALVARGQNLLLEVKKADSLIMEKLPHSAAVTFMGAMEFASGQDSELNTIIYIIRQTNELIPGKNSKNQKSDFHKQYIKSLDNLARVLGISIKDTSLDTEAVFEFPGKSKKELYNSISKYVALSYNNANNVIQQSNEEGGSIVVKALHKLTPGFMTELDVRYTLSIDIKDSKIRIRINQQVLMIYPKELGSIESVLSRGRNSYMMAGDFPKVAKEVRIHNILSICDLKMSILKFEKETDW
jgi:hypothetical protein